MTDLRLYIRKVADELIDSFYAEREIDFLSRYASQLPACLIGHILGCLENIPFFTELVYSTTRVFSFRFTAEEIPEIESSASQLMDYTERLPSARRAAPRDDFLSTYLVAADQAGEMSPLEILIQFLFVIVAGSDTTRGALAVQTAQLLQHREQWEAVCVIIRAVVIPTSGSGRGRGPLSEGSAKELRVVQETAIEATYFPPHS